MTKKEQILKHLQEHGSITSLEAIKLFACTRLSARIFDLKEDGYKFKTEIVSTKDKYGNRIHFTRYKLLNNENK